VPLRTDGRPTEADLEQLVDRLASKENELRADIEKKVQNHNEWNRGHVDLTQGPLSPVHGPKQVLSFRPAKTQYLITPPASVSSASLEEPTPMDLDKPQKLQPVFKFRGVSPDEKSMENPPSYRRRVGRLNRLWIDRRGLASPPREDTGAYSDRWKYDQSSDDEDEPPVYEVDPFDVMALKFRSSVPLPPWMTRVSSGTRAGNSGALPPNQQLPQQMMPRPTSRGQPVSDK